MKKRTINPDQKMADVIHTTRRLFVEHGYCRVTIPDIVKASGVSTGSIYSYFTDKRALARHVYEDTIQEFDDLMCSRLIAVDSTYEALKTFTESFCELTETKPILVKFMFFMNYSGIANGLPPTICLSEAYKLLHRHLEHGIESGEIRGEDYLLAGLTYTGITLRAIELRLLDVLEQPLTEISDDLVKNGWDAIKA